jgi:hypothetical protein
MRPVAIVSALAALAVAVAPAAASAATTRSGYGTAWGANSYAAEANAKIMGLNALNAIARPLGEVCTGLTYVTGLVYIVPSGGGYVYGATAIGSCAAPAPIQRPASS